MKKSCCKKYKRKAKACKGCPLVALLGCKRKSKKVKLALRESKFQRRRAA